MSAVEFTYHQTTAHNDHSVKADFCRANHVDADSHKDHVDADHHEKVRFEIIVDNNNDIQQHNDETKGKHKSGWDKSGCGVVCACAVLSSYIERQVLRQQQRRRTMTTTTKTTMMAKHDEPLHRS